MDRLIKRGVVVLVLLNLLVWGATFSYLAHATGSLSIPNIIANQSGPDLSASLLDQNWNQIRDYVNNRELTIGTLAARPAPGTSGRWYLASDENGGTPYIDAVSTWTQVGAGVTQGVGTYGVRNLMAGTASATVIQASATLINLRNPSTGSIVTRSSTATLTNTITLAGPIVNGQDRATVFPASSFVHLYFIWNGSTLGTLSSSCSPQDANGPCSSAGGPVLPTGYTHFAYVGWFRLQANSALFPAHVRGAWITFASRSMVAASQTSTTSTAISVATAVATNTLSVRYGFSAYHQNNGGGASDTSLVFGGLSAATGFEMVEAARMRLGSGADNRAGQAGVFLLPNFAQGLFYRWTSNTNSSAQSADLFVEAVQVPNGAE